MDAYALCFLAGTLFVGFCAHVALERRLERLERLYRHLRATVIRQTHAQAGLEKDLADARLRLGLRLPPYCPDEDEEKRR